MMPHCHDGGAEELGKVILLISWEVLSQRPTGPALIFVERYAGRYFRDDPEAPDAQQFAGLFFGLPFTKLNPDFAKTVKEKFSPESKLLVVCQEGLGSAAAADALEREGFQNITCITSGLQKVKQGTFEFVGKGELQNAGKAGLVTVQGKISVILGTVLISAYLFITFFPDQTETLFELAGISL